ncbi:MAG: DUF1311 domain-containing protein [Alphaproteobacteria bacterium]|nr:DUF1311 domain-containing protein [Alphaproteobacteria bacterium]
MTLSCVAVICASSTVRAQPSFDCAKASSGVEKLICSSEALSILDNKMNMIYRGALTRRSETQVQYLKNSQIKWIGKRNKECNVALLDAASAARCLEQVYRERISDLNWWLALPNGTALPSLYDSYEAFCSADGLGVRKLAYSTVSREENQNQGYMLTCKLHNGATLRLLWEAEEALPYGKCGVQPSERLSIWINDKLIINDLTVKFGHCGGMSLAVLSASTSRVEVCNFVSKDITTGEDFTNEQFTGVLPDSEGDGFGSKGWKYNQRCRIIPVK